MKKIIRSTNDLLLAVLMGGLSIFLLLSKKIITGVENGLGGMWAQASTYIHLLAGALTGCGSTGSSSAQEVIDYVNANPGKVTVGCTGSNNVNYGTTMELLKDMGIYDKVTIVPYDGGAASETALQGGHIQLEVNSLADTSSYIAAGTNVPLLVCNDERIDACPDVPTTVESGYDVTYGKPRGFFAPKGTDPAILSYISEKMGEVCQNEDFVKAMANLGFTVDYVDGAAAKERTIKWAEDLKPVFEEMAKIAG